MEIFLFYLSKALWNNNENYIQHIRTTPIKGSCAMHSKARLLAKRRREEICYEAVCFFYQCGVDTRAVCSGDVSCVQRQSNDVCRCARRADKAANDEPHKGQRRRLIGMAARKRLSAPRLQTSPLCRTVNSLAAQNFIEK